MQWITELTTCITSIAKASTTDDQVDADVVPLRADARLAVEAVLLDERCVESIGAALRMTGDATAALRQEEEAKEDAAVAFQSDALAKLAGAVAAAGIAALPTSTQSSEGDFC
tara:strand:- start:2823 stop:3161 length:339 start_codon:yes stop_codon:yes gene_type:complete